jgi:hypothetical protein
MGSDSRSGCWKLHAHGPPCPYRAPNSRHERTLKNVENLSLQVRSLDKLSLTYFGFSLLYNAQCSALLKSPTENAPTKTSVRYPAPTCQPNVFHANKLPTPSLITRFSSTLRPILFFQPNPHPPPASSPPLSTRLIPRLSPLDIVQYLRSIKDCIALSSLLAQHLTLTAIMDYK